MEKKSLWLCLNFENLPLQTLTRGLTEEEKQKPLVVMEQGKVCRLNASAEKIGISRGNNIDTAYALSELVVSLPRNKEKEHAALSNLAQWVYQFTPNISIKAPHYLLLEVGGCLRLFKGLPALIQKIEEGLNSLGYPALMGGGKTPLAALSLTRSLAEGLAETPIEQLPITSLGVEDETISSLLGALQSMGITSIGSLLALPQEGLRRRFGTYFVDYLMRLTGERPDPQKYINPSPHFFSEITFLADVTNLTALTFPINRLAGELSTFLKARQLCVSHLTWKLSHRSHPPVSFSIYLAGPENDQRIFLPLTQLKLDQLQTKKSSLREIDSISLTINKFYPARATSGDLFGTESKGKKNKAGLLEKDHTNQLLNMLHARLGNDACFGLSLANDHRPEKALRLVHPLNETPKEDSALKNAHSNSSPRPVFLLGTPKLLGVIQGQPCLGGRLELIKGPERIDFGWWDETSVDKPIARDYYIARQKDGALFWIFNYLPSAGKEWYLHGIFS